MLLKPFLKQTFHFLLLIAFASCGKNEVWKPNPPIDSCLSSQPLTAEFSVSEHYEAKEDVWVPYSTDTVAGNIVRFIASDSSASSYEWRIGGGIYHTRILDLEFPNSFLFDTSKIQVTLTVKGSSNSKCFPQNDTIQTQTKDVTFLYASTATGKFTGYLIEQPSKVFTIEIDALKPCSDLPNGTISTKNLYMSNLVEGCETYIGTCGGGTSLIGYKQIYFSSQSCLHMFGTISIDSTNNRIIIDYDANSDGDKLPTIHHKFIGTRN